MFSPLRNGAGKRLREPFGKAGLTVAVIALVFAMLGGAYAASNNGGGKATASAKGKPGPRGKTGKTGSAGPQGPAGAKGDTGPAGANGKDGAQGPEGKQGPQGIQGNPGSPGQSGVSPVGTEFSGAGGPCSDGGVEFEGAEEAVTFACNGGEGKPWTAGGTLPENATETGAWGGLLKEARVSAPISFSIPLAAALPESNVKLVKEGETAPDECDDGVVPAASAAHPEADHGYLCVFVSFAENGHILFPSIKTAGIHSAEKGASTAGAVLSYLDVEDTDGVFHFGTFAVTG